MSETINSKKSVTVTRTLSECFMDEDLFAKSTEEQKKEFEENFKEYFSEMHYYPPCQFIFNFFKKPTRNRK